MPVESVPSSSEAQQLVALVGLKVFGKSKTCSAVDVPDIPCLLDTIQSNPPIKAIMTRNSPQIKATTKIVLFQPPLGFDVAIHLTSNS